MALDRSAARTLLETHVTSPSLRRHCDMVARAMEAYGTSLGHSPEEIETWYISGLLHDLDWEKWPDEHPNYALQNLLPQAGANQEMLDAIAAHGPHRTGRQPTTELERYLFACDEICGFLDACAKVRPEGFVGMKASSVKKKLKNKTFAAGVSREDVDHGAELINKPLDEHIEFLVGVFAAESIAESAQGTTLESKNTAPENPEHL